MKTEQRKKYESKATEGAPETAHYKTALWKYLVGENKSFFPNSKPSASGFEFERKRKRNGADVRRETDEAE